MRGTGVFGRKVEEYGQGILGILIAALMLLPAAPASGYSQINKMRQKLGPQRAVLAKEFEAIEIKQPWSEETVMATYGPLFGAEGVITLDGLDLVMALTLMLKVGAPTLGGMQYFIEPLDSEVLQSIRQDCLNRSGSDPWKLLVCTNTSVLESVIAYFGDNPPPAYAFITVCRMISSSVQKIFNSYNIPGAKVSVSNFILRAR